MHVCSLALKNFMIIFLFGNVKVIYIYIYINLYYIDCPGHCLDCERINDTNPSDISESNFICLDCKGNYFLNSSKYCVSGSECGDTNYPSTITQECETCNEACNGCTGPKPSECLLCDEKYALSSTLICEKIVCQSDEYLDSAFVCKSKIYLLAYIYII